MEQVFAPWRIQWIEREDRNADVDGCVFCAFAERDDDRANRVVARSERSFVLLNNYPYNPGHVMVIPHRHTGDYADLSDEALLDHAHLKQRTFRAIDGALDPDGFNAGLNLGSAARRDAGDAGEHSTASAAGGSIGDHLHTHVVPRWTGDTNFMPVVADTKVIVEAVEDTYGRLHDAFAAQDGATVESDDRAVRV